MDTATGAFMWKIENWSEVMSGARAGAQTVLHSPGFYTARHGYHLIASVCPFGDGKGK